VLVVGGGCAGLIAALEAIKHVDRVVIVSKRRIGHSGNTVVSGSGFVAPELTSKNVTDPGTHYQDTMRVGDFINDPQLVQTLVAETGNCIRRLEEYGAQFLKADNGLLRTMSPGHTRARTVRAWSPHVPFKTAGLSVTIPLLQAALDRGVKLLENMPVIRLVVKDQAVRGAIGLDVKNNHGIEFHAGAIVLATGGGGQIFSKSNNTVDMTGDGYALALEAGATLRDMEFVQYFPSQAFSPLKLAIHNSLFSEGAKLRNSQGEVFMSQYDPDKAHLTTRDNMARAIWSEVNAGNGIEGGVYMDLSDVPQIVWETSYSIMRKFLDNSGFDVSKQWLVVTPVVHSFMGGVKTDSLCQTGIHGLFVAGEGAGGLHGANRLPGNALNETVVFGAIAGQQASGYAHRGRKHLLPETTFPMPSAPHRKESIPINEIRKSVQLSMWEGASVVRSRDSLHKAAAKIQECQSALLTTPWHSAYDLAKLKEVEAMSKTAQALVASALKREETRGSHFRSDYPSVDDTHWFGNIEVMKGNDDLEVDFIPVSQTRQELASSC
jgi:succinate dehydrogenase/fumarate reductase flavoprotein subunit|tara:strand:- start:9053 stop:10699 length:1647 start_codon:yes stop_codon:yes gene_type:complete